MTDVGADSTQLALGAVVALLLLREVFAFLRSNGAKKTAHNEAAAGEKSVEFWLAAQKRNTTESLQGVLQPFLQAQSEIMREIRDSLREIRDLVKEVKISLVRDETRRSRDEGA